MLNEGGLEYYCSHCNTTLRESIEDINTIQVIEPCPECGSLLSQSLQKRPVIKQTRQKFVFQYASKMPKLCFDIKKIDSVLSLRPGQVIGISGKRSQYMIERLCVRAQMPRRFGGLDSNVILIDGNNRSDVYLGIEFARQYGLKVDDVLSKIISSRAFTIHQLASLVVHSLYYIIQKHDVKIVVISDILGMFANDPYLDLSEAKIIVKEIVNIISKLGDILVIVSMHGKSQFDDIITRACDEIITVSDDWHRLEVTIGNKKITLREEELLTVSQV
jgi:hypothetical protein